MKQETSAKRSGIWLTALLAMIIASGACTLRATTDSGHVTSRDRSESNAAVAKNPVDEEVKGEVQVKIEDFAFKPTELTIEPGTRVTWINKDEDPHTATSTEDKFNSGGLDTNQSFSFVFHDKGDYPYFCALHPHMKAVIKVK